MPRYFLDYADGQICLQDQEGQCYRDLRAARDAAIAALPDIGREPPPDNGHRAFTAYVRDEAGTVLCTVTLNLAAECHPERQKRAADTESDQGLCGGSQISDGHRSP